MTDVSKKSGFEKLGIAFCIGLEREAKIIHEILTRDFDVSSVCL